jgi:Polysaccharide biosynthesis C-terminal domain
MARGRARTIFRFSILLCGAHLTAFAVGLEWGVVGVAAAYAISSTLIEPINTVLAARSLGVSPMVFFRSLGRVFQAAIGMCAAVLLLRTWLVDVGTDPILRLLLCIGTGAAVYAGLCAWRVPELAEEARALLRRRARQAPAPVALAAPAES